VSGSQVGTFFQIERRVQALVDLELSAQLRLVGGRIHNFKGQLPVSREPDMFALTHTLSLIFHSERSGLSGFSVRT
jgi:hypothetical protein